MHFKVKPTTKFEKIMSSYASNKSIDQRSIRFLYEGRRLQPDQTPQDLGTQPLSSLPCSLLIPLAYQWWTPSSRVQPCASPWLFMITIEHLFGFPVSWLCQNWEPNVISAIIWCSSGVLTGLLSKPQIYQRQYCLCAIWPIFAADLDECTV